MLQIGDRLLTQDGRAVPVEGVAPSGQRATVYNWRIAEYHTYYVSAAEDRVSLWAHNADYQVNISRREYPEAAAHIEEAQAAGAPAELTIDRAGAAARRRAAMEGQPSRPGFDRDEYPPAMFQEGGTGSDVRYINPSDNRGAGASMGNQLRNVPDGSSVQIVVVDD
jgi:hypothetical protein